MATQAATRPLNGGPLRRDGDRPAVRLLDADPVLGEALAGRALAQARAAALADVATIPPGPWEPDPRGEEAAGCLGLLVLDGLLLRHVDVAGSGWTEILGVGDVVRPWTPGCEATASIPAQGRCEVLEPLHVAILDRRLLGRVAAWPELVSALAGRLVERQRRVTYHLASSQSVRIEDRLWVALWHLADRWGRVGTDGVIVDLPGLTHQALARMVGAQRPSTTSAIGRLQRRGLLDRDHDRRWVLRGEATPDIHDTD